MLYGESAGPFPVVIPAKAGIHARHRHALKRQVSLLPSRNEVVDFRLQAGHFLVNSDKKVTKEAPPRSRRPSSQEAEAR
jgi:hypothetical protein